MPIYEYKCLKKGHVFEALQSFSDKPLTKCQVCKGPVEKLVSSAAFHLKGGGWYVTDYKNQAKTSTKGVKAEKSTKESGKEKGSAEQLSLASKPDQSGSCSSDRVEVASNKKLETKKETKV